MHSLISVIVSGVAVGCVYALIALGFTLIYKATEVVNFAQGELLMIGAFVAYSFIVLWGWGYWAAIAATMIVVAVIGFLIDAVILRRIIGQPQFSVVMLTIGLGFVLRAVGTMIWGTSSLVLPTPFAGAINVGGVVVSSTTLSMMVGAVFLCGAVGMFFGLTRVGVAMQAASQNQLAAYYMGVPVKLLFSLVWAISGGIAAIAGVLIAPVTLVDSNLGFLGLKAFAAAVLGGFGSVPGALVGGVLIGLLEQLSSWYVTADMKDIAAYVALLAVLFVRPQGLLGSVGRKKV
ncbi:branched-chain amino acid ABC transporter permease [Bradyrhizobium sp. 1]|uniref:branched-chain amino acid ABC transporter permease n=1 Tax=Bradyrhizobium sp. 1 TaxID=241591 RepID=UPI001FF725DB|nr:branched-chain amino acid ABC transporter permease [Bradyrhizobium sp. 1]MCK1394467.1 branched-chain amino acid ABC transporter permease [Bradyrhizobium sp. 1]